MNSVIYSNTQRLGVFTKENGNKSRSHNTTRYLLGSGQYLEASGDHCHLQPPNPLVLFDSFHSTFDGITELYQLPSKN
jgi:hypothetical protein